MEHPAVCCVKKKKKKKINTHPSKSGHYSAHQASVVSKELAVPAQGTEGLL